MVLALAKKKRRKDCILCFTQLFSIGSSLWALWDAEDEIRWKEPHFGLYLYKAKHRRALVFDMGRLIINTSNSSAQSREKWAWRVLCHCQPAVQCCALTTGWVLEKEMTLLLTANSGSPFAHQVDLLFCAFENTWFRSQLGEIMQKGDVWSSIKWG